MEGVFIEERDNKLDQNQKKSKLVDGLCLKKGRDGRRRSRLEIKRLKENAESESDDSFLKKKRPIYYEGSQQSKDGHIGVLVSVEGEVEECRRNLPSASHGSVAVCGRRRTMEDTVTVIPGWLSAEHESFLDFFAVYDGHGGASVAQVCRDKLHRVMAMKIEEALEVVGDGNEIDWNKVLEECFLKMDDEVDEGGVEVQNMKSIGSTAVVALIGKNKVIVANCGDSRAVLARGGMVVPLSHDHKPDRPDELERVEAAGGRVINWNGYRVLGVLATSRSIGDQYLKPYVISVPEVSITERTEKDEFVILASDGLWDVMSNEVACQVVRKCLNGRIRFASTHMGTRAAEAAAVLAELAMARGSRDNISVVVVQLNKST